ncbi:hypothetical protein P7C70_g6415, partial [Phenoliferia sp. Uapishka_3]
MVVYHIVIFKLNPETATPEAIANFVSLCRAMVGAVPGLISMEVGPCLEGTLHRAQGYDFGLCAILEKVTDLPTVWQMDEWEAEPEFDPDLELELDESLSGQLGGGLGLDFDSSNAFASSLYDQQESTDEEHHQQTTPTARSRHSSSTTPSQAHADALGLPVSPTSDFQTHLRRPRGPSSNTPSSNRLSLAFELASAASPGKRSSNRDLLRSLGIEEDEGVEDEDEDSRSEGEDEEDFDDSGYGGAGSDRVVPGGGSPPRNKSVAMARPSSASLASAFHSFDENPNAGGFEAIEMAREESDAAFLGATSALESALESTGAFLGHLRQHTSTAIEMEVSLNSPRKSSFFQTGSGEDYTDRQPQLENLATGVIKSMYEITQTRESQVRELSEMERLVANPAANWQAALSSLAPLSPPASPSLPSPSSPSASTSLPPNARIELSNLRDITSSLISALSSLSELSQVNNAGVGEAGRKLRALRGHLGTAKEDLTGLEKSERFVKEYERKSKVEGRKKGWYAEIAREQMRGAEEALDLGWRRAKEVLEAAA